MCCYNMLTIHHNGKKIDCLYPEFESDLRNLKLDLVIDGMNP